MKEAAFTNPFCVAKTRSGKPCEKFPLVNKRRCRLHGGLSTGPKTVEGKERIAAANTKHGRYVNWRQKRAKEKYYLGEIKRVLNDAREEQLGIRSDLIEHQLAHVVRDATGEAYNRTRFFPERIKLMQRWADYLEDLKEGGGTISNNVSIFRKEA